MNFSKQHESHTIQTILKWNKAGKLNLSPGFQRSSVWIEKNRKMLIDTILRGMPLPNLFFWENKNGRKVTYDVIDGKQRIESLLEFTKAKAPLKVSFDPENDTDWAYREQYEWTWKEIRKYETKIYRRFLDYEFPVVIVRGNLPDVEQVFIRINSTGMKLTPQEIRHAKWYENSGILLAAESIAKSKKYERYFTGLGILSSGQVTRMKAIEIVSEFMLSIEREDVLDRKKALDKIMGAAPINMNTVGRLSREVKSILDTIKAIFPYLHTSRFRKPSDFYALFFVIWKMKRDGYNVKDKAAASIAFKVLNQIGLELASYSESSRSGKRQVLRSPAREYHSTVLEGTDSARHRRARVKIIENILMPIFQKKDSRRQFSLEQKQLLWHSSENRLCSHRGCKTEITWNNVHMDHITAHSKGGMTDLRNAQIMCAKHNIMKSNK